MADHRMSARPGVSPKFAGYRTQTLSGTSQFVPVSGEGPATDKSGIDFMASSACP